MPSVDSSRCVAAVDLGASNGRVVLGRFQGGALDARAVHRFEHEAAPRGGYLRWDWAAICAGIRQGLSAAAAAAAPQPIECVSACGWAQDFGLLDGEGRLIFEPVCYREPRSQHAFEAVMARLDGRALVRRAGVAPHPMTSLMQLRARAEQEPEVLARARTLLFVADLVHHELCGKARTDSTLAAASQMTAVATGDWDRAWLRDLGVPEHILPDIAREPAVLGPVRAAGLPHGLAGARVAVTFGHDTASAFSVAPEDARTAVLSSGTWSMLGCRQPDPVMPDSLFEAGWALIGLAGGQWGFVKGIAGLWLLQACRRAWKQAGREWSYEALAQAAADAAPARQVFDTGAAEFRAPADMPAAIAAYCRRTRQPVPVADGELAVCILASLALEYRRALSELERATGRAFSSVCLLGGGNRNRVLNQLTADAVGMPVLTGPSEATAAGNLLAQARLVGILPDAERAAACLEDACPPERFEPRGGWVARLAARFDELKAMPAG